MVRLTPAVIGRKQVWVEDAPAACGRGHEGSVVPTWGHCPACDEMVRLWLCRAALEDQPCDEVLVDDEHVHHSRHGS